jgi:hypothetical protein
MRLSRRLVTRTPFGCGETISIGNQNAWILTLFKLINLTLMIGMDDVEKISIFL